MSEALDGGIGSIDEATYETSQSYIVVDTGPWIFGKKVLLPAGVVQTIDLDCETVFVDRTKDEIKDAPEFDGTNYREDGYRPSIGDYYYYGRTTAGGRSEDVFYRPGRVGVLAAAPTGRRFLAGGA